MKVEDLTRRQGEALRALSEATASDEDSVTPSRFAMFFWPGKRFARGNGPWGLGPDASGRHGGRMLTRLSKMGLVRLVDHDGYYTAKLSWQGQKMLEKLNDSEADG